jgi:hypothetical protein
MKRLLTSELHPPRYTHPEWNFADTFHFEEREIMILKDEDPTSIDISHT